MHCAMDGNLECVKFLKEKKVDMTCEDNQGNTLIHQAALSNKNDILAWLLSQGTISVDKTNGEGKTAVHLAVVHGSVETLRVLKDVRADFMSMVEGKNCLQLAEKAGRKEVYDWLLENTAIERDDQSDSVGSGKKRRKGKRMTKRKGGKENGHQHQQGKGKEKEKQPKEDESEEDEPRGKKKGSGKKKQKKGSGKKNHHSDKEDSEHASGSESDGGGGSSDSQSEPQPKKQPAKKKKKTGSQQKKKKKRAK